MTGNLEHTMNRPGRTLSVLAQNAAWSGSLSGKLVLVGVIIYGSAGFLIALLGIAEMVVPGLPHVATPWTAIGLMTASSVQLIALTIFIKSLTPGRPAPGRPPRQFDTKRLIDVIEAESVKLGLFQTK